MKKRIALLFLCLLSACSTPDYDMVEPREVLVATPADNKPAFLEKPALDVTHNSVNHY